MKNAALDWFSRENLNRKPSDFPMKSRPFRLNFPSVQRQVAHLRRCCGCCGCCGWGRPSADERGASKKKERGHQIMMNIWLMYGYSMVNDG